MLTGSNGSNGSNGSKWRKYFSFEDEDENSFQSEFEKVCTLSYKERMIGFGVFFGLGLIFDILAVIALVQIVAHPSRFAIIYTIGNLITISSTLFLFGPCSQVRNMFKAKRIVATLIYFGSMAFTLFAAYQWGKFWIVALALLIQFLAMVWYCASYIPWGRSILTRMATSIC